ncbi:hypothetical protein KR018_002720, partial [Drosophila ironensis]
RNHQDPAPLFKKLDELETESNRLAANQRYPEWNKSSGQVTGCLVGPELASSRLYRENFSHYDSDLSEHGERDLDHSFSSMAARRVNAKPQERLSNYEILGFEKESSCLDPFASMVKDNYESRVAGGKSGESSKSYRLSASNSRTFSTVRPASTYLATTRKPTVIPCTSICLPDASRTPSITPPPRRPSPPSTPRPITIPRPPSTPRPPSPPASPVPTGGGKCGEMPKKILNAAAAKKMIEIILQSKQHALALLKHLNYMEMELLGRAPDTTEGGSYFQERERHRQRQKHRQLQLQKQRLMSEKNGKTWEGPQKTTGTRPQSKGTARFSFGIRPVINSGNPNELEMAKEEELKLEERVWEEHKSQLKSRRPFKPKRERVEEAPPQAVHLEPLPGPLVVPQLGLEQQSRDPLPQQMVPNNLRVIPVPHVLEVQQSPAQQEGAPPRRINVHAVSVFVKPGPASEQTSMGAPWNPAEMATIRLEGPLAVEAKPVKRRKIKRKKKKKKYQFHKQPHERGDEKISGLFY